MYGSISPLNHHRLKAWQSGGVHVRLTDTPVRGDLSVLRELDAGASGGRRSVPEHGDSVFQGISFATPL
jgi:hypothetical protein